MPKRLTGKVCLVTGATRGIGKGIALQLGEAGAKVYITGRTLTSSGPVGGSLTDTAKEVEERGGECIAIQCDHSKDSEIKALFERISAENKGQLDVLVNNAYSAVNTIMKNQGVPFWEQSIDVWDSVNNVGLRNHYMCAVYASRLMTANKQGLIVNISSAGGLRYLFNVAYGIGKEACDRMAADCAFELRKQNVAFVSLWPGAVNTEEIKHSINTGHFTGKKGEQYVKAFQVHGETPEYAGKAVVHLALDSNIMSKSGKILITGDLGDEYGFTDQGGKVPANFRRVRSLLGMTGHTWLAGIVPMWIKVPGWLMALGGNKF